MKSKMKCTLKLIALMIIFTIIGGCTVKQKAHTMETSTNCQPFLHQRRYSNCYSKASRLLKNTTVRTYELHKVE